MSKVLPNKNPETWGQFQIKTLSIFCKPKNQTIISSDKASNNFSDPEKIPGNDTEK